MITVNYECVLTHTVAGGRGRQTTQEPKSGELHFREMPGINHTLALLDRTWRIAKISWSVKEDLFQPTLHLAEIVVNPTQAGPAPARVPSRQEMADMQAMLAADAEEVPPGMYVAEDGTLRPIGL